MNTLILHDPPPQGSQVSITYHDPSNGNKITLFMFVGDGKTHVYNFASFAFDHRRITITVDGVLLSPRQWTLNTKMAVPDQSVIKFNEESIAATNPYSVVGTVYQTTFTLSTDDYAVHADTLHDRIVKAIDKKGYKFRGVNWAKYLVFYTKPENNG